MNFRKFANVRKGISLTLLIAFALLNVAPFRAQVKLPVSSDDFKSDARVVEQNLTDDPAVIYLNTERLDVNSERARVLRSSAADFGGRRLHLVKFGGAIQPKRFKVLEASGFQVVDYIPNYAYLV